MGLFNLFKKKKPIEVKGNSQAGENHFADISHWESCDFNLYDKKVLFTKCTGGKGYVDPTYKRYKEECLKRGIKFGAYHFFKANLPAIQQAEHFLKNIGPDVDFLILDLETTDGATPEGIRQLAKAWLEYVHAKTGKLPILYSYHSFLTGSVKFDESFAKYPLWLARYANVTPTAPAPWKDWAIWQYSDKAFFNGIGECDGNVYNKENSHGLKLG